MTFYFSGRLCLRETAMLLMCARYKHVLMTQEIVRSKDAQCHEKLRPPKKFMQIRLRTD